MQQLAALWSALQGKKTYLLSALAALWPLLAPLLGQSGTFDLQSVLIALAIAALRAGIASSNPVAAGVLALLPKLQPLLKELEARGPEAEKFLEQLLAAAKDLPQPPAPDTIPFDPNALRPGGGTPLRSLLLFVFLCLPLSGHCASPKAVIKGPRTAVPGEFLRYDFGSSTGMKGFRLEIDPKNDQYEQVRLLKAEKAAEVASFKGVYKLTLTVWDEQDDSDVAEWIVAIADPGPDPAPSPTPPDPAPQPAPTPTPGPTPAPVPEPVLPDGKFGVLKATRDAARAVQSTAKAKELQCLIDGCVTVKAQIAAGTLKSPQAIVVGVGGVLASCVSPAWDAARNALADKVEELFKAGQLKTVDDCRGLVDELQSGLEAAR